MNPQFIIDLTTFETLKDAMGADYINELVQAYFDETPQLLSNLQNALQILDYEAFRRAAHSIKSTSYSFGALKFGEMAKELEILGREAKLEGAANKVESLISGYKNVHQALEELCHG